MAAANPDATPTYQLFGLKPPTPPTYYNFVLHGDRNVGKTSLFRAYASGRPNASLCDTDIPALRFLREEMTIDGKAYDIQLQDFLRAEPCRSNLRPPSMLCSFDGLILVCALDDLESFYKIPASRDEMLTHVPAKNHTGFPLVLLANKRDIADDTPFKRRVPDNTIQAWCNRNGVNCYKTSNREADVHVMHEVIFELVRKRIAYEAALAMRTNPF